MIYLDNTSATRPGALVLEAYQKLICEEEITDGKLIEDAYKNIFELVGANSNDQFLFMASEREAAEVVFSNVLIDHIRPSGKNHLLASAVENASILQLMERYEEIGLESNYIPVDENGLITISALEKMVGPRTGLIAFSWVNSLTGVIQPVWEIAEFCRERGILVYVQASTIFAKLSFRFQDLWVDFLSFEGNKFHAPKGTAGLFVKHPHRFMERSLSNAAGLVAMGIAAAEVLDTMGTEVARLRGLLEDRVHEEIKEAVFFGQNAMRVPGITCFAIPGLHGEPLSFHLRERGVIVTRGGGERPKLEYVLANMGVKPLLAKGAISLSLSIYSTEDEIERFISILVEIVKKMRKYAI